MPIDIEMPGSDEDALKDAIRNLVRGPELIEEGSLTAVAQKDFDLPDNYFSYDLELNNFQIDDAGYVCLRLSLDGIAFIDDVVYTTQLLTSFASTTASQKLEDQMFYLGPSTFAPTATTPDIGHRILARLFAGSASLKPTLRSESSNFGPDGSSEFSLISAAMTNVVGKRQKLRLFSTLGQFTSGTYRLLGIR